MGQAVADYESGAISMFARQARAVGRNSMNAKREATGMSWRTVAKDIGVSPSLLSRIGNGYRADADGLATLVRWLGMSAESFMMSDDEDAGVQPELVAQLAPLFAQARIWTKPT